MLENRNRPTLNRWYVAILVCVCSIYGNSLTSISISPQEDGSLLEKVRGVMGSLGWEHLQLMEHITKKTVHSAERAVLGGLTAEAYGSYGRHRVCNRDALMLISMVPFVDETARIFVAGWSGQISDVWLDMSRVTVGMTITAGVMCRLRKKGTVRQGGGG